MAAEPNHVGSPHDKANADCILAQFKAWGWDAHIETFKVLYPTPLSETLEMLGPKPFTATLQEPPIPGDTSATAKDRRCPPIWPIRAMAMSPRRWSMSITAMSTITSGWSRLGISVKGKIVIARYGESWRGLKVKLAQDHGAVGVLIYSDPADDGYSTDLPLSAGCGAAAPGHPARLGPGHDDLSRRSADARRGRHR